MQTSQIVTSAPPPAASPAEVPEPLVRFALLCILFLLAALWLEPYLAPLCRATAAQVGALLALAGLAPRVHGDLVTLSGFNVRIVAECTPLYPFLLYGALVLAQPSSRVRTLAGLLLGALVITAANALRISLVTAAGTAVSLPLFDICHVYLGQVAMLLLVLGVALVWLRWSAGGPAPFPFLLRAGLWATALFVPWVAVHRSYVALLDDLVAQLFALLYPGYQLLTPRPFLIYNHTFALPLFLALVLADSRPWTGRRLAGAGAGACLTAGWHALFRVSHVVWTALSLPEIMPLHQAIYLLGQFLLPFLLWLLVGSADRKERGGQLLPVPFLVLMLTLCWSSTALAEPVVSAYFNGRGGFAIKGNNLNRVTEAEIRVDYKSEEQAPAQVSGAGLGGQATVAVQADRPGSFTIRLKSGKPMSGSPQLATAQIRGTITFLSAWLRNDKGAVETPGVVIANPTEEQLSAMAPRRPVKTAPVAAPAAVTAPARVAPVAVTLPPVPKAASPVQAPQPATRSIGRRKSVLELLRSYSGERTPAALARLFERRDDMFSQEPPVLLSDGSASLRLTVNMNSDRSPKFAILDGSCRALKVGEDGAWVLEIVPARGSLASSVAVLSEDEVIEFPLAVAPPLELFDGAGAGAGEAEYVDAANWLALRQNGH